MSSASASRSEEGKAKAPVNEVEGLSMSPAVGAALAKEKSPEPESGGVKGTLRRIFEFFHSIYRLVRPAPFRARPSLEFIRNDMSPWIGFGGGSGVLEFHDSVGRHHSDADSGVYAHHPRLLLGHNRPHRFRLSSSELVGCGISVVLVRPMQERVDRSAIRQLRQTAGRGAVR